MKKLVFLFAVTAISFYSVAQESGKIHEIGLTTSDMRNFGITYRMGNTQSVWRFNTVFLNGSHSKSNEDTINEVNGSFGLGLHAGKEYRKLIIEKFELRYGMDLSFRYGKNKTVREYSSNQSQNINEYTVNYSPGVNLVLGLNYVFAKNFLAGIELLPYFNYTISKSKDYIYGLEEYEITKRHGFSYGISNQSVMLSLSYRF